MALRWYEAMFLMDSAEASKDVPAALAHVEGLLKKQGAEVLKLEKWDDRKLAYDIGNVKRGTYILAVFQSEPERISELRRELQLSELVLRNLILEDEKMLERMKEREALKKKREAEAAQAAAEGLAPEGDRERRRFGDRDRDRDRDRGERYPRRERAPVAAAPAEGPADIPGEMG